MQNRLLSLVVLSATLPLFFAMIGTAGVKLGDAPAAQPKGEELKQPSSFKLPTKGLRYPDQEGSGPVYRYYAGTTYYSQGPGQCWGPGGYGQNWQSRPEMGIVPNTGFIPGPNNDPLNPPPKMRPLPGGPIGPLPGLSSATYPGGVVPVNFGQVYPGYGQVNQDVLFNPPPRMRDVPYSYPVSTASRPSRIQISVPVANAEVWVEGTRMTSTGLTRHFVTPSLAPGKYQYNIVVRWTEQGEIFSRTRSVSVRPGDRLAVVIAN
jgi:uncharacterized protein (TIGR03000 family)